MTTWLGVIALWVLPEIVLIILLFLILWVRWKRLSVRIILWLIVIFLYWYVRAGDEYYALKRMEGICSVASTIEIYKTVALPESYWSEDGTPKYFDEANRFQGEVEGVEYEVKIDFGGVDKYGIEERVQRFVNKVTGEVYGITKSYGYVGSWYERFVARTPPYREQCLWSENINGDTKRSPKRYSDRLESWILVPNRDDENE